MTDILNTCYIQKHDIILRVVFFINKQKYLFVLLTVTNLELTYKYI